MTEAVAASRRIEVPRSTVIGLGVAAALIALIVLVGEKQALVFGATSGASYGILAIGLVLIYKSSGVFNFAQGEFGTVAAFSLYLLDFHMPFWFALLLSLVIATALGFLVERIIIRPLFSAPRVILLVATAGVALLAIGIEFWFVEQPRVVARAFERRDRVTIFGINIADQELLLIGTLAGLAILLGLFFSRTNLGLAIIGASQEPTATELVGISVRRLSSFTWAFAALLGGIAGVLTVGDVGSVAPGFMTSGYLIAAFSAAVLGGMTSLPGAFLGGIIIGIVQGVASSADFFSFIPGSNKQTLLIFAVLVIVLVVRPQGLVGKKA